MKTDKVTKVDYSLKSNTLYYGLLAGCLEIKFTTKAGVSRHQILLMSFGV